MAAGRLAALTLVTVLLSAAAKEPAMTRHATGTFEVKITPEAQGPAPEGGLPTGRMAIAKTFTGGMTGTAAGIMLSAGEPKPGSAGAYIAVDQFSGAVDGRRGGFLLVHRGTMDKAGNGKLDIIFSPDTGTGDLSGIAGTLSIRIEGGVHHYDLAYTLPG